MLRKIISFLFLEKLEGFFLIDSFRFLWTQALRSFTWRQFVEIIIFTFILSYWSHANQLLQFIFLFLPSYLQFFYLYCCRALFLCTIIFDENIFGIIMNREPDHLSFNTILRFQITFLTLFCLWVWCSRLECYLKARVFFKNFFENR